ncbi:hypothetical protein N5C81_03770 [Rhizobium pusense]|uniref:hypothetical protein n=1 Tax=Agrobacterium pusense TaxID=648995 RepID=UPI00244AC9B2|nr:hypothetical protein [Agrobacterium pusense]MDH1266733.1 hypothetical protein [Agrobacterium pusense]
MTDLNTLAAEIHASNAHWWRDPATGERIDRNKGEMLMLVVSELSEAMEGERKDLMDDHLPHRKMAEVELADVLIRIFDFAGGFNYDLNGGRLLLGPPGPFNQFNDPKGELLRQLVHRVQDVAAYAMCRGADVQTSRALAFVIEGVVQYAEHFGYDIWGAMAEKLAYNAVRADHKNEARLAANGKKW